MTLLTRLPEPFLILLQSIQNAGFRLPVVVEGDAEWSYAWVIDCLAQLKAGSTLWYSQRAPKGAWQLSEKRIQHELGREAEQLVFDGFSGINVDALASMSGALKQGGCLFLLCPPLSQFEMFDDPFNENLTVEPWGVAQVSRHYILRLARLLESSRQVVRIRQAEQTVYPDQLPVPIILNPLDHQNGTIPSTVGIGATADQRAAVQAVLGTLNGHRKRPLVLLADRGRGKSAAIGLALKTLRGKAKTIALTAPRRESVETLLSFAEQAGSDSDYIHFYAADYLLDTLPNADLLVIDEAAAIAPAMLVAMLQHYSRVVMATTVQGYEGTGRGFEIRFHQLLEREYPGWKCLRLHQPIRWQQGDWLEQLINTTLMPSAKRGAISGGNPVFELDSFSEAELSVTQLQFESIPEPELAEVFDLLTNAHYRTRPTDLRTLMDAVNIRCFVLKAGSYLLGIAMIAEEGQLAGPLAEKILSGQRRPKGQILPQTMAVHLGVEAALQARFWRIVRIAIQPEYQARGLGTKLLQRVQAFAESESIDALGSVFSATAGMLTFWQKSRLALLRIGYTRESTTGGYSALVMQPISSLGSAMVDQARCRLSEDLPLSLMDTHRELPAELTIKVISMALAQKTVDIGLLPRDQQFVLELLTGRRVYENGSASVWRWVWHWLDSNLENRPSLAFFPELIILRVLQNLSWSEVVSRLQLTGQKQARKQLQGALSQLTTLNNGLEHQ